ncbi:MAG: hypothetical protein A3I66_13680 [Burkholderiales bacterium RIFCSPLOWO2_02_FULL_57_36]|nr:MAG: hypothetical protein A3I66_13680 [Burkholderiales bacterium RIFCSPLOWO2_02_FULL_57_36]
MLLEAPWLLPDAPLEASEDPELDLLAGSTGADFVEEPEEPDWPEPLCDVEDCAAAIPLIEASAKEQAVTITRNLYFFIIMHILLLKINRTPRDTRRIEPYTLHRRPAAFPLTFYCIYPLRQPKKAGAECGESVTAA